MTAAEHARQVALVRESLLRVPPVAATPARTDHDLRAVAVRR